MQLRWLTLTLAACSLAASGCFEAHGLGADAGTRPDSGGADSGGADSGGADSGMCAPTLGSVYELRCTPPAFPGGSARVTIVGVLAGCCASATADASARSDGPFAWRIDVAWTACDCCATCRCIGPEAEATIEVGPLEAGTHTIRADGASCTIEVSPPPECSDMGGEVRAPAVLLADQNLSVTFTQTRSRGCGCRPVLESAADELAFAPQLCGCCGDCDCIDQGYEASLTLPSPGLGHAVYPYPGGVVEVDVVPREGCRPIEVDGLRVVGPDPRFARTGPDLWWVEVSGTTALCCAASMPAVDEVRGPPTARTLWLLECAQDPCPCVGEPTATRAWFALGELPSGSHAVRAGDVTTRFDVP